MKKKQPSVKKEVKKAKQEKKVKEEEIEEDEDLWTDELHDDEELEEVDVKKIKFTKIKELKLGMENVNITAKIDFIGPTSGKEYGDEPYAIGFLKDETGEIKMTFWGDDIKKAKKGTQVRVIGCDVTEFRGQLQINPDRRRGIEFL
jgi:hypothetical protein